MSENLGYREDARPYWIFKASRWKASTDPVASPNPLACFVIRRELLAKGSFGKKPRDRNGKERFQAACTMWRGREYKLILKRILEPLPSTIHEY
jgi:hypothetical protein